MVTKIGSVNDVGMTPPSQVHLQSGATAVAAVETGVQTSRHVRVGSLNFKAQSRAEIGKRWLGKSVLRDGRRSTGLSALWRQAHEAHVKCTGDARRVERQHAGLGAPAIPGLPLGGGPGGR